MHDIVGSKKVGNGITVLWEENSGIQYESFTFQELLDMQINALDLIERPTSYRVNPVTHHIRVKK